MDDALTGGCQCGSIRYRIEVEPRGLTVCHCRGCQRQSGSAFGMSLDVASDAFRLVSGKLTSFTAECDSGRTKECAFCPRCGTRIFHEGEWGKSIKAGTLDEIHDLAPDAHYWTDCKQGWVSIPESTSTFADDG